MAARLDIILFGATGFTGKHTIPEILKFLKVGGRTLTWGVAGRSEEKLKQVLSEAGKEVGVNLNNVPIIVADIKDEASLKKMAGQAKLIINCCGPYRLYGEQIVKACVEMGTHHVDVSGEPQYMEKMQLEYNKAAEEKGIYIVSACGFDSIPTDLGIVFLQKKFEGTVNSVETYITVDSDLRQSGPAVNYGTWESAVYGLAHWDELRVLRSKLYPTRIPTFQPKLQPKTAIHKSDITNGWCVPFLGSDRSVALRSQRYFYDNDKQRPVQVHCYLSLNSILAVIALAFFGSIFKLLTTFEFGRKLLLNYPRIFSGGMFSHESPSEETIRSSKFAIYMHGQGWSDNLANPTDEYKTPTNKSIKCKVSGSNPGYGVTCTALVLSGIMILTEADKLPSKGGVYPPAAAFKNTSIIEQLHKNGLSFEVLDVKTTSKL